MKSPLLFIIIILASATSIAEAQPVTVDARTSALTGGMLEQVAKLTVVPTGVQAIVLREQIIQNWENEAWVNGTRITYDYEGDFEVEALTEQWDGDSWENLSRFLTSYSGDQVVSTVSENWDGSAWVPDFRTLYTYSGDTFSEILYQSYVEGEWVDEDRTTVTMSNGLITETITETWDGTQWVFDERFTLGEEGDDVVATSQDWNGSEWVNTDRTVYTDITIPELYDFLEQFATDSEQMAGFSFLLYFPPSLQQEWDGTQWVNVSRQVVERDSEDRPTTLVFENWEEGAWVGETRYVATYNAEGDIETLEWQNFDGEEWMPFIVETHFYDNAGLLERIVSQFDFGTGLQNSTQYLFEWTNTSTAVGGDELPESIRLATPYPNPFNPQATVEYHLSTPEHATLRVFDATGRLVRTLVEGMQPAGDHSVTFDATGLPSGVYMLRLQTPSHLVTRSVTLLR